ncbi:isochorismatase family protein [Sneathiella sp. P13V-1]|uniref:cysteine hydrolase family protein n=1 Tax=Sneathiella sp. P13V-1 TaxID=2697366 RepID=UPI00187BC08B|nr:isochorismatase family cysteine hydrolase [Sneathiella sp. P13V-1]MBE7635268.1 isochorismatase family protein [Sneathiella sp. P13V-1]
MPIINTALPFAFPFEIEKTALIVIDMQRDFLEPGGFGETLGNDVSLLAPVIPATAALLKAARGVSMRVLHTREAHKADLSDCPTSKLDRGAPDLKIGDEGPMGRILISGEPGADIVPELAPVSGETVIDKPGKGAFYGTDLVQILGNWGVTHLLFAGVTTEVCVQTTMREANDRGFDCLLVEECTGSYFPEFKTATLDMIRAQGGIIGWTAELEEVKRALEKENG